MTWNRSLTDSEISDLYNRSIVNSTSYSSEVNTINWTNLNDNHYHYFVDVSDVGNNYNTTPIRTITLDTTLPVLAIVYPQNTTYSINVSELNYTYTETYPEDCWYSNDSGKWNSSVMDAGVNFTNVIPKENSNTWTLYCNDSAGNENSTSITFFKDTIYPEIN